MKPDRHTKPGGWAEFKDWDMHLLSPDKSLNSESRFAEHHRLLCGVCESVGQTPYPGGHLKGWLEEAGFINVQEECLPVPIGPWPKDRRMVSYHFYHGRLFSGGHQRALMCRISERDWGMELPCPS